ncbi:hypothetical protein FAY30_16180 [Bacillus sp. S3]|uniref:hypothetical protein n=1 Tax=Bacillus sp. S3 TaxID=486398 RepID=UPI0011885678|nr:hypothetical protein [Bacillus sp. S3]QCJ43316.1 hypothetical protein FAY30_16180 [Bacillus sp. S3]
MKKSEWSDRELEELLRQMPRIQDHRDPRDIYQNLSLKKRKRKPWLLPGIAAVAALLLFFILAPKLMDGTNISFDQTTEEKSSATKEIAVADKDSNILLKKEDASSKEQAYTGTAQTELAKGGSIITAVYDADVESGKVFTYWIPDPQAQILIPVSTIINDTEEQSWLTVYTKNMENLKEAEWGLSDFYPLKVTMVLDEKTNTVLVDVPADHQYGQGAATETNFLNILKKDIASNSSSIKKIKFSTNGVPGIELGNYGSMNELDVVQETKHAFLFYYPEGSEIPYLTTTKETFNDINQAIEAMKSDQPQLGLKSSLKPLLPLHDVSVIDKTLYVSLKGNTSLQDNQQTTTSFESLLMTAKEFGLEKVVVKDSVLPHIGPFDLSLEQKVPLAPNLQNID